MKVGDLVRMESCWQFPKWFYGIVVEVVDVHHYYIQWLDDGKKTYEDGIDLEVIDEKAIM